MLVALSGLWNKEMKENKMRLIQSRRELYGLENRKSKFLVRQSTFVLPAQQEIASRLSSTERWMREFKMPELSKLPLLKRKLFCCFKYFRFLLLRTFFPLLRSLFKHLRHPIQSKGDFHRPGILLLCIHP